MLTIPVFEYIASFVVFGIAYILCATLTGYMQTWLLDKIGDSTAHKAGYLTFNPLVHTTIVNLALCAFFGLPWYTSPPVNAYAFTGRLRHIKALGTYSIVILVLSVLTLVFFTGAISLTTPVEATAIVVKFLNKDLLRPLPFAAILNYLHGYSRMTSAGVFLLSCLASIALIMSAISFVNGVFNYISYMRIERQGYYDETNELLLSFGPFILFYFFAGPIISTLFKINIVGALKLAGYLGLA